MVQNKKHNAANHTHGKQQLFASFYCGLRQKSIPLTVNFNAPAECDLQKIKGLLEHRFHIDDSPINTSISRNLTVDEDNAQHFFWLAMVLATSLLQAINIPSFSVGVIKNIKVVNKKNRSFQVAIRFPVVENHSLNLVNDCIVSSCRLVNFFSNPFLSEAEISSTLEELHKNFINKAKNKVPGGDATIPILKAAFKLNIPFIHIDSGIYQIGWGALSHTFDRSTFGLDSAIGARICQNKALTANIMKQAGLPTSHHRLVSSINQAQDAANQIGYPVVVKPADRDRGEGVTINVKNFELLKQAFDYASTFSKNILVERQVAGTPYRILVADNSHLYTVMRLPKSVMGDGQHTIKELCTLEAAEQSQKAVHLRKKPTLLDKLAEDALKAQGLDLNSIPQPGELVFLRPTESTEWGGTPQPVTELIHPDNIRIALMASQLLNLNVAGVDLISEDISKPWHENGAVINEVNFAPFLGDHHDYQRKGVEALVQSLFKDGGRIPIEIFIGDGEALKKARKRQRVLVTQSQKCFLTTHEQTFSPEGEVRLAMTHSDRLYSRCRMLLMHKDVECLLIVIQTDEFVTTGLPMDSINTLTLVNEKLLAKGSLNQAANTNSASMIIELLKPYCNNIE